MSKFLYILVLIASTCNCSQVSSNKLINKNMENTYPFRIAQDDGQFSIIADLESEDLLNKYYSFFEKHGYEGNGYCWEGHIIQILEKKDKELINQIEFDPEAGAFYAYADSMESQVKLINIISPIFTDLKQLEKYVLSADRDRIED